MNVQPLNIGSRKQLFIDDKFIAWQTGIALSLHPPAKAGPALIAEAPWEQLGIAYACVIPRAGEYAMYYHAAFKHRDSLGQAMNVKAEVADKTAGVMCLAVSKDGCSWQRRPVGRFEILGGKDNNIVLPECVGTIALDPHKTGGFPYWFFGSMRENPWWEGAAGAGDTWFPTEGALYLARSRDGLAWERVPGCALPFLCDTHNQVFFDTRLGQYVYYVRGWEFPASVGDYGRVICRGQTDSLLRLPWPFAANPQRPTGPRGWYGAVNSELPIVMRGDEQDPPVTDLYNPCVHQYSGAEDVYLAFPSPYRHYAANFDSRGRDKRGRADDQANDGPLEIACAVSRDGAQWRRFRQPYVPLGLIGEVDGGVLYMASGMIIRANEIWQYYIAHPETHGNHLSPQPSAIIRLKQRLDGFVSADAGPEGGELTTPVIRFDGHRLQLNIDCGAMGEAWVELQDAAGLPIPGFTLAESVSIDRNGVAQETWWQNGPDLGKLADRPIRLHFKMRSAKLYAFQFVDV